MTSKSSITINDGVYDGLPPTHPGEILRTELDELGLSISAFAAQIGVPTTRIAAVIRGQRSITADTALRLAAYFGTSADMWLNLQTRYDLKITAAAHGAAILRSVRPRAA